MLSVRYDGLIKSWRNEKRNEQGPQRITKIKPFINKYNWEGTNFPSEKDNWKIYEKNNVTISLNVLYARKGNIYPAYVSKYNSNREKRVVILIIPNGEGRHFLAVKKTITIIRKNNV